MENALEFLLEQAKEKEEKAVLSLGKARQELSNYYEQLKQIEQYRLDYCNQLVERGQNGLTASQYWHLNRFLTQLDETLAKQRKAEGHFQQQVTNCEEHWLTVRKQTRSYEWLIDKRRSEREKLEQKKEQKFLDEFATLQFNRQQTLRKQNLD
ncbi:flagellar export protein FliJ [Vibrio sp.]|uniref:Flagellar FliJ protein n=1 Tax=Vibrio viridaestus TaxID=2487322 RepID=A0A3N9U7F7_9VIBR|nr:flagellar export protein FliJ [Vibrio viridaestus]MDC0611041.1 flagellar export protein FliJ [Vibrio sp.]RQW64106.1 flagella biosynthesis chaperone FliJ [Vibrio viridaestus]